jgi:NAD(P)-dependent dehydrogenase (short-subunit alcohol dehydrogenase family)
MADGVLAGKVAMITGGSRGLGRRMAVAFAREGAQVIVASRKYNACQETVAEIETAGGSAFAYACHVGRWAEVDALVDAAYDQFGRVDVLVNNAGMSPGYDSLEQVDEALYDKVLDVNLKGPFHLTALIGSRMARGDGGSILNISSTAAVRPGPTNLPYAAAKAGLNALTLGFARAFGPTVRVNAIMAGPFRTTIAEHWDPEFMAEVCATQVLGRIGEPDEIVGSALYFAGSASTYTTGAILSVDGGLA